MSAKHFVAVLGAVVFTVALFGAAPAVAFDDCPTGVPCTHLTGSSKKGSHFRISVPENWDGDLFLINHGFNLNQRDIRPHETCKNSSDACEADLDCGDAEEDSNAVCNVISYFSIDEMMLPLGKAVAASTYSQTGWSVFKSRKDLKEILKFMKKASKDLGRKVERVFVTGFSMGGAVTVDATQRMKINGAVPLCPAAGGGLPSWDSAVDVRLIYDYLCDEVGGKSFNSPPDVGESNTPNSDADAIGMALTVNNCFGNLLPSGDSGEAAAQADRLARFRDLTKFSGTNFELPVFMGFVTLGMGDFVRDKKRLAAKPIGWNAEPDLDYTVIDSVEAAAFDAAVERLTAGRGRKKLSKNTRIDFTKGKGKKADYPIVVLAGTADWVAVPEFQRVFADAVALGGKTITNAWVDTPGHCTFSFQEIQATLEAFLDWNDGADQPTKEDIESRCLALPGGVQDDTCNFDNAFSPPHLTARVPARSDWFPAAQAPAP